ncbi:MAG: DUF2804 domain-containing protein [Treponema sp.]|jgi:hypothetical protein|nr:DUF2804 domain-containing protein [Treponema sp.]
MYTREIQVPRDNLIENGVPLTGTWNKAFARVDLLGIHRPYSVPLPRWLLNYRIKEWESFSVQDKHFYMEATLGNFKLFQMAQVFLYDKKNEKNYIFRKMMAGNSWRMPNNLYNASVECRDSRFFFRIHTWLNADTIKLDIDIAAAKKQPALTAHLEYFMGASDTTPVAVSLNFAERRNMYVFKSLSAVRGDIVLGDRHVKLNQARCMGLFRDYKGFFPYRVRGISCGSMGFDGEGCRYGFHIVENQAKETRKNNENALWINGQFIPLPPVRITIPKNPDSDWVIQDLDGMVDLVFSPRENDHFTPNIAAFSGDFFVQIGYYNGMLVSNEGRQIQVRNQWGIGEKLYLRV